MFSELKPAGVIAIFAGELPPDGWAFTNGQPISRIENPMLFQAIGTRYGEGDGSTTFNLPDLRGRAVFGHDVMGATAAGRLTNFSTHGIDGATLGSTGGSERLDATFDSTPTEGGGAFSFLTGEDMNNVPPAMILHYIIRLG